MSFKSRYPKALSYIFMLQFIVFVIISISKNDFSFIYWALFLILPIGILLYFSHLKVTLDDGGIRYSMPPFVDRKLLWADIEKVEIIKISPLNDFLGWGIRFSPKYGWSYILETDYALAIVKKNGKKLALSIDNKEKASSFLQSVNQ